MVDWLIGWRQKREKVCVSAKKPSIPYANHFLNNKNILANLLLNLVFFCAIKSIFFLTIKNAFRTFEKEKENTLRHTVVVVCEKM